jgi:hypothetical protein
MKLYLTKAEQKDLLANGTITIEREPVLARTHKSSILHGIGTKQIWNKVDRIWVYGDTKDYYNQMENVGRRATDYPNNSKNVWSGDYWIECERDLNEYGQIGTEFTNGRKNIIRFKLNNMVISELRQDPDYENYNRITFKINIILVK